MTDAKISALAISQRDDASYECDALRAANERLGEQVQQLLVVRDKQRIEIEFLHDRLRQIVLLAQSEARR